MEKELGLVGEHLQVVNVRDGFMEENKLRTVAERGSYGESLQVSHSRKELD